MSFLSPEYFWLFLFLVFGFLKKDFKSLSFVASGYIITFIFIVLALSRPVIKQEPVKSEQFLNDVILAVDLSYSMKGRDVKPSRLQKAKEDLKRLILYENKSRFAIIGFTTNAIILSPLTQDSELLQHLFNSLDEELIITKGSSIMPTLKLARKISKAENLSVVIFSDGADKESYKEEAIFAKENSLIVNIFMLATSVGTTLELENNELLKDENGNIVVSGENSNISLLSDVTGGVYTKSLLELSDALKKQKKDVKKIEVTIFSNIELFFLFVLLAIISFLITITTLKKRFIALLLLVGINLDADILNFFQDKNIVQFKVANDYYKNGEYEKAFRNYEMLKSSNIKFKSLIYYNMANSLVRLKEFEKARVAYVKSLTLNYTKEAYENLINIYSVKEQMQMNTGKQQSKKNSSLAKKNNSQKKKKDGGSSNMKVSANASSGADDGKKTSSSANINLNSTKVKLSSKQYELINKRGVNEKQPW